MRFLFLICFLPSVCLAQWADPGFIGRLAFPAASSLSPAEQIGGLAFYLDARDLPQGSLSNQVWIDRVGGVVFTNNISAYYTGRFPTNTSAGVMFNWLGYDANTTTNVMWLAASNAPSYWCNQTNTLWIAFRPGYIGNNQFLTYGDGNDLELYNNGNLIYGDYLQGQVVTGVTPQKMHTYAGLNAPGTYSPVYSYWDGQYYGYDNQRNSTWHQLRYLGSGDDYWQYSGTIAAMALWTNMHPSAELLATLHEWATNTFTWPATDSLQTNLVSYWPCDEGAGRYAYQKWTGNYVDDLNSVYLDWTNGVSGSAICSVALGGAASHRWTVANNAIYQMGAGKSFTFRCWVKSDSFAVPGPLAGRWGTSGTQQEWVFHQTTDQKILVAGRQAATGSNAIVIASTPFVIGEWMHVAVGFDSPSQQLWVQINGNPREYSGCTDLPTTTISLTFFNWGGSGTTGYTRGALDEMAYWSRSLTEAEVSRLYNGGATFRLWDVINLWSPY